MNFYGDKIEIPSRKWTILVLNANFDYLIKHSVNNYIFWVPNKKSLFSVKCSCSFNRVLQLYDNWLKKLLIVFRNIIVFQLNVYGHLIRSQINVHGLQFVRLRFIILNSLTIGIYYLYFISSLWILIKFTFRIKPGKSIIYSINHYW